MYLFFIPIFSFGMKVSSLAPKGNLSLIYSLPHFVHYIVTFGGVCNAISICWAVSCSFYSPLVCPKIRLRFVSVDVLLCFFPHLLTVYPGASLFQFCRCLLTPAVASAWLEWLVASVCPRSKRKLGFSYQSHLVDIQSTWQSLGIHWPCGHVVSNALGMHVDRARRVF